MNSSFLYENRMPKTGNYSKFELENRQVIWYNVSGYILETFWIQFGGKR